TTRRRRRGTGLARRLRSCERQRRHGASRLLRQSLPCTEGQMFPWEAGPSCQTALLAFDPGGVPAGTGSSQPEVALPPHTVKGAGIPIAERRASRDHHSAIENPSSSWQEPAAHDGAQRGKRVKLDKPCASCPFVLLCPDDDWLISPG